MLASSMCIENEAEAEEIASWFPDILAYIKTIEAPYPFEIDQTLAVEGQTVFESIVAAVTVPTGKTGPLTMWFIPLNKSELIRSWRP